MKLVPKTIASIMLLMALCCIAGCTPDDPNDETNTYVDLGLPSGTLWATCNLGATAPEQYGDYYAWGETTPKTNYSWSTYRYCHGTGETLTKYCNSADFGYNGFTDNLTVLQPNDDAATVVLGEEWCMPTRDQWMELSDYATWQWKTKNGVKGMLVTGKNGNSLFLPAGGGYHDDNLFYFNVNGLYWTSELHIVSSVSYCDFNADFVSLKYGFRSYGYAVRPVRAAQ